MLKQQQVQLSTRKMLSCLSDEAKFLMCACMLELNRVCCSKPMTLTPFSRKYFCHRKYPRSSEFAKVTFLYVLNHNEPGIKKAGAHSVEFLPLLLHRLSSRRLSRQAVSLVVNPFSLFRTSTPFVFAEFEETPAITLTVLPIAQPVSSSRASRMCLSTLPGRPGKGVEPLSPEAFL